MKLSRAGVWDISLVGKSNIIQLFIILNCLGGWPACKRLLWHYGNISSTKEYASFFSVSLIWRSYILPPSEHIDVISSSTLFTICTQVIFTSEALRLYITVTYKFAYMEYIF